MDNKTGVRNRDMIFIASRTDEPLINTEGLTYDYCREYYHDGFQRAKIDMVNPNAPMNGVVGRDTKNKKITHKVRVFKHDQIEVDKVVIWVDGPMLRLLQIDTVMQDPKSRRHMYLYCVEKQYSTDPSDFGGKSYHNREVPSFMSR